MNERTDVRIKWWSEWRNKWINQHDHKMNEIVNVLKFNANELEYICYHMLFVARKRMSNIDWQVLAHFLTSYHH